MGTPEFAVPSLQILVENGFDVVASPNYQLHPGSCAAKGRVQIDGEK